MNTVNIRSAMHTEEDEAWWRTFVFPEEERGLFTTAKWDGGYRWFRASNVVCIEQYRRREKGLPRRS